MKNLSDLKRDITLKSEAIKKLETSFPAVIGVECVKIIRQNFKLQGYEMGYDWPKRSPVTDAIYEYNRTKAYRTATGKKSIYRNPYKGSVVHSNRPILVQTGNLRDSVTYKVSGKSVMIGVFSRTVNVGGQTRDALQYAKIHNEGGRFMMFGKHLATMPQRQFMPKPSQGPTLKMLKAIREKYNKELVKIMKGWQ